MLKKFFDKAAENENPLINDLVTQFAHFEKNFKTDNVFILIDYI